MDDTPQSSGAQNVEVSDSHALRSRCRELEESNAALANQFDSQRLECEKAKAALTEQLDAQCTIVAYLLKRIEKL